jgi:hypothetical protein
MLEIALRPVYKCFDGGPWYGNNAAQAIDAENLIPSLEKLEHSNGNCNDEDYELKPQNKNQGIVQPWIPSSL